MKTVPLFLGGAPAQAHVPLPTPNQPVAGTDFALNLQGATCVIGLAYRAERTMSSPKS